MKKALSIIIWALLPMVTSLHIYAYDFQSNDIYYSIGDNNTVSVSSGEIAYSGYVEIPNFVTYNGVTYSVTSIGISAFKNCSGLSSVIIPNSVTAIGSTAFGDCSNLSVINLPNSVTEIGDAAFYGCSSLTTISIPNKLEHIGSSLFWGCTSLTSVYIPASVTSIGEKAFLECTSLSYVTTDIQVAFSIPSNVFEMISPMAILIVPQGCKASFLQRSGWYYHFSEIREVGEGSNPIYHNGVIYEISSEIDGTMKVTSAIGGWTNIEILQTIAYNGKVYTVTSIVPHAFERNTTISSMQIPNSVISIGENAFGACSNLSYISIPNSVVDIGEAAFYGCTSLTSFVIPNSINTISSSLFWGCVSLKSVTIPESVTYICEEAFRECMSLESITIPANVGKIDDYAFYQCSSLSSVYSDIQIPFGISTNVFEGIAYRATLTVPRGSKSAYQSTSGWNRFPNIVEVGVEEDVVVTANSYSREYGEENPSFSFNSTGASLDGTPTITCDATKNSPVGTYAIKIAKGSITNSNVTYVDGTLTVTEAPLTITAKSYSREEGQPNPLLEVIYSGFKNNETEDVLTRQPIVTTTATMSSAPGNYEIAVYGAEAKNYNINYVYGSLTVTSSTAVTIIANSYEREYGESNPTFEYTTSGAALDGIPTISCDATITSPVGTYNIMISKGSVTNNNVTYISGTLTITKAPLTVSAISCTREQGQENPNFDVTYSGFKNGENESVLTIKPIISTTATLDSAPGDYDIMVSGGEAQNYSFIYKKGILTVTEMQNTTFEVNGITYLVVGNSQTAEVLSVNSDIKNVVIPSSVSYNGKTYQVTSVADYVFSDCDVNYISLPASVISVTNKTFSRCNMGALIWNAEAALPDNVLNEASMRHDANFLLYVNSASYAPTTVNNVVVNGVASSVLLSDEGGKFYCPEVFMAGSISYTHNYSMETGGSGMGWETIALPFSVQKILHSDTGMIVTFASYSSGSNQKPFWLCNFTDSGFRRTSTIQANEPYIIAMPNSKKYLTEYNLSGNVTFSAENVIVPKTPSFSGKFLPVYDIVKKSSTVCALNVKNRYVNDPGNYDAGSRFISNLRDVRPFEAYMNDNSTRGVIEINFDDGTTDLDGILLSADDANEITIHILNGQQVAHTTMRDFDIVWQQLPKGVYIVNGVKRIK